jgi:hypothetical protein
MKAPLPAPFGCPAVPLRKLSFHFEIWKNVSDSEEWRATNRGGQSHSLQRRNTRRHQSFATGFFAWECAALEEFYFNARAPQQNRKRRTGYTSAGNQHPQHRSPHSSRHSNAKRFSQR